MVATVVAGYYNANGSLYRFAAMELVEPAAKERAISWVLAGGILGAVAGPQLASTMRDALPQPFAGAYAALMGVALLAFIVMSRIPFPPLPAPAAHGGGRGLAQIARQPVFIVAVSAAALASRSVAAVRAA
jgi:predicted MFS family arabinose efflux permease